MANEIILPKRIDLFDKREACINRAKYIGDPRARAVAVVFAFMSLTVALAQKGEI